MTQTQTLAAKRARVVITRADLNKTVSDVFLHEIPVLVAEFGQGNVEILEGVELKNGEVDDGVDGEYARLQRKFRRPNEEASPTTKVYGSPAVLATAMGVLDYRAHTGLVSTLPESMQYDGAAEDDASKPRRGRPPKAETGK